MWVMNGERRALRRTADPVVAPAAAGVRIRTRVRLTEAESAALTEIGSFLGSVFRTELAARVALGGLDHKAHAAWRAQRKQALTTVSSSRWAGAVTRAVEDQYQLGMRVLNFHVRDLRAAVEVLETRCALRPGEQEGAQPGARQARLRGYPSAGERFAKTRRLAVLRERLAVAQLALAAGRPSITVGGKRLWRNRNNLDQADMAESRWRARWDAARRFVTADGESGKSGGNETIRVDEAGQLRIKVPAALVERHGTHINVAEPVSFAYRGAEWAARVAGRRAVRYDISYDSSRGRWYLDASWKQETPVVTPSIDVLRTGAVLGLDLNSDHLAACVLDDSGNPVGDPITITVDIVGLVASRRDGRVRAAISALLDAAVRAGCAAVVVENLDFADARVIGRETMGRGKRGKQFRRIVAGIPTAKFRNRLTSMAARRGIAIIVVDPAYTSKWGAQHWVKPLQQQTSERVTRHHGAAIAIGRRGLGQPIRRRPAGPRNGQRTVVGTPPARPDRQPIPRWQVRQFRPTAMHTMRNGPPENTHHQRATPFGAAREWNSLPLTHKER
jgi:IS605 OrfB family transposase